MISGFNCLICFALNFEVHLDKQVTVLVTVDTSAQQSIVGDFVVILTIVGDYRSITNNKRTSDLAKLRPATN